MMKKVLLLGGSGVLGSALVEEMQKQTVSVVVGSRHPVKTDAYDRVNNTRKPPWVHVDLVTGEGLLQALVDVDTVFHLASSQGNVNGQSVDVTMTRVLLKALEQADVRHLLYSSIVGVDTIPYAYFRAKFNAEALIRCSRVPYTILRATQFHSFVDMSLRNLFRFPIGLLPKRLRGQPIDVQVVAAELYRLAQAGNQQGVLNIGGPDVFDLGTLVETYRRYRPVPKLIIPIPTIGALMNSFARGQATCPGAATPSKTWEEYLRETYG